MRAFSQGRESGGKLFDWVKRQLPTRWELRNRASDNVRSLSEAIRWSSLATVGDSPLLKLTIIIPFLGYVIIYNDHIMQFLMLSKTHIEQVGYQVEAARPVTTSRLNYIYFGLTALGIASAIFALFAPKEIVKHRSPVEYVQHMEPIATKNVVRTGLTAIMEFYRSLNTDFEEARKSDIFFPYSLQNRVQNLINDIYGDGDEAIGPDNTSVADPTELSSESEIEYEPVDAGLYNMSRDIMTSVLVQRALSGARINRYFESAMFNSAPTYSKDVFILTIW